MYFLTFFVHYLIGIGILRRFQFSKKRWEILGLAFPLGLGSATLLLFLQNIIGIPLTFLPTFGISLFLCITLYIPELPLIKEMKRGKKRIHFFSVKHISLTEWLFYGIFAALFFISAWRCYHFPVKTYDSIVGIDLVAKFAVEDKVFKSRIFNDLKGELSAQPYYAPFTAFSQIIYRLSGLQYGKSWLSLFFLSLLILFYGNLREKIHPVLAGFLTLLLVATPEMYGYTYLLQTDFANAVFVSLSVIYIFNFLHGKKNNHFWIAAILFGFATWARSETIGFTVLTALLIFVVLLREKHPHPIRYSSIFFGISFFFFAIWNLYYLPFELDYTPQSAFKF